MKIYHKYEEVDKQQQLVIYVEYPDNYEFGLDFDKIKENVNNVSDKIRAYILKNVGKIKDNNVLIVLNGVVVGTLLVSQLTATKIENNDKSSNINIEESLDLSQKDDLKNKEKGAAIKFEEKDDAKTDEKDKVVENSNSANESSKPQVNSNTNKNNTSNVNNNNNNSGNSSNNNAGTIQKPSEPSTPTTPSTNDKMISLKLNSGQVISIALEDYIIGVVGAEMPASFNIEALKAQAVAARTYALKRSSDGTILSATTSHQVYKTNSELKAQWGSSYNTYYNKVKSAVNSTKGQYITYNGNYIDALYFSCSNGKTEDPANVWGNSFPYLKSVDSSWDKQASSYLKTTTISKSTISSKLGVDLNSIDQISIDSRTIGDRIKNITICGKTFTGVEVRNKLGLRSADFDMVESGDNIVFTTRGFGHGVGMSQYGANIIANSGSDYIKILKYYYTGVQIKG